MDFAELFTDSARDLVAPAWNKGLLFLFDYGGTTVDVLIDRKVLNAAVHRLGHAAIGMLHDGFVFVSAQTEWHESGQADIAISIAGTGSRSSDDVVSAALQQLQLAEREPGMVQDTTDAPRIAEGVCPISGASVTFAANRSDGILFAMDFRVAAVPWHDVAEPPSARGARAWLIGDKPGTDQSLMRRLQRLEWATSTFTTPQRAAAQLAGLKPGMARPSLVIATESATLTADSLIPLRTLLPQRTQFVLATSLGSPTLRRAPPGLEVCACPFSPSQLLAFTRRAHAMADPFSGETMPAPLSFSDRPRALVVDDNSVNLLVGGGLLQVAGFEVTTANGGEEAIERCREKAPQLVLMDVHMPGMDGLETTRRMRELQREGTLPHFAIVASTADAPGFGENVCRAAGMDGYLSKPLSLQAIQSLVGRLLPGLRRSLPPH